MKDSRDTLYLLEVMIVCVCGEDNDSMHWHNILLRSNSSLIAQLWAEFSCWSSGRIVQDIKEQHDRLHWPDAMCEY